LAAEAAEDVAVAAAGAGEKAMNEEEHMSSKLSNVTSSYGLHLLLFAILLFVMAAAVHADAQSAKQNSGSPPEAQKSFATPQQAADALIEAAGKYDVSALLEILGAGGKDLVSSADPVQDKNRAEEFAVKAQQKKFVTTDPKNPSRAILSVGNDEFPFPVPIVKRAGKWYFDSKQGHDEILFRRIGANELDAIQVCRGFVEAQKEYASATHDDSGVNQYAQKIISTPGKRDGLYWQNEDGTPGGPISEPVARAIAEGYSPSQRSGYHGYYFKVLKGQGPAAPLGQLDYVIDGVMIGGFALVAVPAEYRVTGVKTFMVSYDGIVYQKDLGPDSLNVARKMERYNPDKTWQRTDDQWPPDTFVAGNGLLSADDGGRLR
jgi:Protein of unknown function (DUF2950)